MTYIINLENTGLETSLQVMKMAELMQADGHDVEYTLTEFGNINPEAECPVSEDDWFDYLERADAAPQTLEISGRLYAYDKANDQVVYRVPGKQHGDGQIDSDDAPVWLLGDETDLPAGIDVDDLPVANNV